MPSLLALLTLLLLFLSMALPTLPPPPPAPPPNILFILADDLGFADLDWRDPQLTTPNLRKLAFSPHSVQLINAYVGPLCTPSRTAMLSGLYPFRTGTQNVFLHSDPGGLNPKMRLLPQLIKERGYRTHLVGKWHLGYCHKHFLPTARGFDTFYGFYGPQEGYYNHSTAMLDHNSPNTPLLRGLDLFREIGARSEPDWTKSGKYSTDLFTDEAIRILSSNQPYSSSNSSSISSSPFFLMLSFQAVHAPLELAPKVALSHCANVTLSSNRRAYCGILAAMDAAIGRLIKHLKDIGAYDRTVVIFGTDNGGDPKFGASNAPLKGGKGTLWEGGTRSTVIVHSPDRIDQFGIRKNLFHAVDWPATILGMAGVQIAKYGDGINQWPMLIGRKGPHGTRRTELIYALDFDAKGAAIRDGQFKLLLRPGHRPVLFNIGQDPSEQKNLAEKHRALVRKMSAKLIANGGKKRMTVKSVTLLKTNPKGWPQRYGGVFKGGWC